MKTKNLLLPALCALAFAAQPAFAAHNISNLQVLGQSDFDNLSQDLGSALSYKPVAPSTTLGATGFDIGLEFTQTNLAKSAPLWNTITNGGGTLQNVVIPKLHITKGLPFGFDVSAFYSKVPTTNISFYGGALSYAIMDGGLVKPTIGLRAAFTKLSGVNQLAFNTKSLDLSISKGFVMVTPYLGLGKVWVNSSSNVLSNATGTMLTDNFTQNKIYGGVNLNLGLVNIDAEMDKTGSARSTSVKLGFRF